jgi:hypothetical protein
LEVESYEKASVTIKDQALETEQMELKNAMEIDNKMEKPVSIQFSSKLSK